MSTNTNDKHNERESTRRPGGRIWAFRVFLIFVLAIVAIIGWQSIQIQQDTTATILDSTLSALSTHIAVSPTRTVTATQPRQDRTSTPLPTISAEQGVVFFAARERGFSRLWMAPTWGIEPVPLVSGDWNDTDPAVSPMGDRLVFSSDRNGTWDLYLIDLRAGTLRQLTDTKNFEAHPTWSPDGVWVAYESYDAGDFDIWILPVSLDQEPIRLTNHPANDTDPDWDPQGRRIAFVSDREGSSDIYIAALDQPDDRFFNLTNTSEDLESDPAFSPDGSMILYSADSFGVPRVLVQSLEPEPGIAVPRGSGHKGVWSPDGQLIISIMESPQETQLISFSTSPDVVMQSGLPIIREVESLTWSGAEIGLNQDLLVRSESQAEPLYDVVISSQSDLLQRIGLAPLPNVRAPNPSLSDAVDEAFIALRQRIIHELGWDFLSNLDYAFTGLNDPLPPGMSFDDWLYTGRAFSFSLSTVQAGWVEVVRQEFEGQTYWHVFVRASNQDGSLGVPLREHPWDFDARFRGSGQAYDQGGELKKDIPNGYYVDFTKLAGDFGFERLPALSNWRTYYHGARFNEFVFRDGMDWQSAMLELYPPSALITPTPFKTPTPTPTRTPRPTPTPWWLRWVTPTAIPTNTPLPTATATS